MSTSQPISLERRLDAAIEQWKRKLLDLTKRNRALNFKPTKVATVTVVGEHGLSKVSDSVTVNKLKAALAK